MLCDVPTASPNCLLFGSFTTVTTVSQVYDFLVQKHLLITLIRKTFFWPHVRFLNNSPKHPGVSCRRGKGAPRGPVETTAGHTP